MACVVLLFKKYQFYKLFLNGKPECEAGKYGPGCAGTCNVHCGGTGNPCDHVTGSCSNGCDPGYIKPSEKCAQRKFLRGTWVLRFFFILFPIIAEIMVTNLMEMINKNFDISHGYHGGSRHLEISSFN